MDSGQRTGLALPLPVFTIEVPTAAASRMNADQAKAWKQRMAEKYGVQVDQIRLVLEGTNQVIDIEQQEPWTDEQRTAANNLMATLQAQKNAMAGTPGNRATRRANAKAARRKR